MYETTPLMAYTLFYSIVATCFVLRTNEFVSNGFIIERMFEGFIEKEYNNFVMHHIRRTTFTIAIHSALPIGYVLSALFVCDQDYFLRTYYYEIMCLSLVPVVFSWLLVSKWISQNWDGHPLSINLSHYDAVNWRLVAQNLSTEYQRIDKLTLACGTLSRIVVTQNWIISIGSYNVNVAKKAECSFLVYSSDDHNTTPDGTPGNVQFINIQVIPIRSRIKSFFIRIRSEDLRLLEEHIGQPINIAGNVRLQQSRTERFIAVFRDQVSQNPVYKGYTTAELEENVCAGCLMNPPDVKLIKCCEDNTSIYVNCTPCQCRPMWCVDCMAKWYQSRQSQNDTTNWLSSKCTCPLCRQIFCILDVCPLQNSELAKID